MLSAMSAFPLPSPFFRLAPLSELSGGYAFGVLLPNLPEPTEVLFSCVLFAIP